VPDHWARNNPGTGAGRLALDRRGPVTLAGGYDLFAHACTPRRAAGHRTCPAVAGACARAGPAPALAMPWTASYMATLTIA
jgi:hypothetical protein